MFELKIVSMVSQTEACWEEENGFRQCEAMMTFTLELAILMKAWRRSSRVCISSRIGTFSFRSGTDLSSGSLFNTVDQSWLELVVLSLMGVPLYIDTTSEETLLDRVVFENDTDNNRSCMNDVLLGIDKTKGSDPGNDIGLDEDAVLVVTKSEVSNLGTDADLALDAVKLPDSETDGNLVVDAVLTVDKPKGKLDPGTSIALYLDVVALEPKDVGLAEDKVLVVVELKRPAATG